MIRFLLIVLTLTSSAEALDVAVQVGAGEFKNKLPTSYQSIQIEHDFNERAFIVRRYQNVKISGGDLGDSSKLCRA